MDIKEQILVALGLNKEETIKLEWQAKSEDGTIFVSTAEELEAGVDISVLTEDGTTILLPVGTYKTDTGVSFRVEEEGIVAEVIESETEEVDTVEEEDLAEETVLAEEDEKETKEGQSQGPWKVEDPHKRGPGEEKDPSQHLPDSPSEVETAPGEGQATPRKCRLAPDAERWAP